jgi:hypothetical protein
MGVIVEEQGHISIEQMELAIEQAKTDHLWAIRGKAIAAYAGIERGLCELFSFFGGMKPDIGSIIFFRISNPGAIGAIMQDLLVKKYGDKYSVFWKSLDKFIRELVAIRNRVVHWSAAAKWDSDGYAGLRLMPPDFRNRKPSMEPSLGVNDLEEFIAKCDFITGLCMLFLMLIQPDMATYLHDDSDHAKAFRDIFQRPIVYPPPDTHPLFQKPKALETPPPPSPASPPPPP